MGWSPRLLGALAVFLCGLVGLAAVLAPAAGAAVGTRMAATAPAAPGDPWLVDRPRFEPLDGSPLAVAGEGEFRGAIQLTRSGGGLAVVNHVALDDYLRGISEVPVSWPLEAQKAQAIAARTYALHEVGRKVNASYKAVGADICATDACQVYTGLAKERRPGSEAWNAAVAQTKGQVLIYRGAPIVAKYSSSNGGRTVSGGQPYLRAIDDPDDRYSPLHQWVAEYPLADVVRAAGFAPETMSIHRDGGDVVATALDAEGAPVQQRMPATDFRLRINGVLVAPAGLPSPVPSVRYEAITAGSTVQIVGRGWGHGIGLSQFGALGKALRGLKAPDILASYYAGLRPVEVPADRLPSHVKVALAVDRVRAAVSDGGGHFRIVDGEGNVLAHRAAGTWSAEAASGGRIRLVPPPDQAGPPGAVVTSTNPPAPAPAVPLLVHLELVGPAAVTRLVLARPDGSTSELDPPTLRGAGPVTVRLAASTTATSGTYRIDVERDAGGGRATTTNLDVEVAAPAPQGSATGNDGTTAPAGPEAKGDDGTAPGAGVDLDAPRTVAALRGLATVLLVVVTAVGGLRVGRRPGVQLH